MHNARIIDLASPIPEGLMGPSVAETDVAERFEAMKMRLQNTVSEITVIAPDSRRPPLEALDYLLAKRSIRAMDDIFAAFIQMAPRIDS